MNKIVIELCDEDRRLLESLTGAISLLTSVIGSALPEAKRQEIIDATGPCVEHPADASVSHFDPPAPAPDPVVEDPTPEPISLGEFQKAIVTRCAESVDTKQKVQALVHKYAESVSAIPEEKRAEVLAALAGI